MMRRLSAMARSSQQVLQNGLEIQNPDAGCVCSVADRISNLATVNFKAGHRARQKKKEAALRRPLAVHVVDGGSIAGGGGVK